jgi:hypothetical protein
MTRYWIKIALGAALVFAIGMMVVTIGRVGKNTVVHVAEGTGPIRIPLMLVPFRLDGVRLGTMRQLIIFRDSAQRPTNLELSVAMSDSLAPARLAECILALMPATDTAGITPTDFTCASAADTAGRHLVQFGELHLRDGSESFPLLAPEDKVQEIRERSGDRAADLDEAAQDARDSVKAVRRELIDSIRSAAESQAQESRAEAIRLVDSIEASLESLDMADAP